MASRSLSAITSATREGSAVNEPRKSHGSIAANTNSSNTTIGAMCTRKSLNVRPARLPMMMFGGSPISVAAPPMLDASTSAIRYGTGLIPNRSHTSSVTGAISSTVVTWPSVNRHRASANATSRSRQPRSADGYSNSRTARSSAARTRSSRSWT